MRLLAVSCAMILLVNLARAADDAPAKPVPPAEAAKMVGKKVTVEMEVKSAGKSSGVYFLNSEENFRDAKNFTLFINQDGVKKFQEAKIDDPGTHFKGKKVRATGMVKLYQEKAEIVIDDPKQIEIVEKKD